jgi:hypothetical protein
MSEAERAGAFFAAYVAQLARGVILEWDVTGEDGTPLPCDPGTIEAVMHANPDFAAAFDRAYSKSHAVRLAEGNVSGPAPNGISAAGPATVPAVPATRIVGDAPI